MSPAPPDPPPERLSPRRWWVCVLLLLATILNYMDRMVLNQTALRIKLSLGLDDEEYGWRESAFAVGFALGAIAAGYVVDRVSVRWVYPLMVLGWSLAGGSPGTPPRSGRCCRSGCSWASSRPATGRAACAPRE